MVKKDNKKIEELKKTFDERMHSLEDKKQILSETLNSFKDKEEVLLSDDELINSLIDECYLMLSELTNILNEIYSVDAGLFLDYYGRLNSERTKVSTLKDTSILFMSHKWREEITKQIQNNRELQNNIEQVVKTNEDLSSTIEAVKKESEETVQKAISSQKAVEESSNRFITIVALLVSLVAIIFGNISQFISSSISWNSVIIINSSILLSTALIFLIIENNHLFSLKVLLNNQNIKVIKHHQVTFNIFLLLFSFAIIAAMIVAIVYLQ